MNYIKKLEQSVNEKDQSITEAEQLIQDFRAHLRSPKFTGISQDGSRLDWIATSDVESRLLEILNALR